MAVVNLADFLLARITEDEETARRASVTSVAESRPPHGPWWSEWRCDEDADQERGFQSRTFGIMEGMTTLADVDADRGPGERGTAVAEHIIGHDPTRVLADCAAKRRIVELRRRLEHPRGGLLGPNKADAATAETLVHVFKLMALPYADHPDYDPEWRV